jgi:hypothetical protein
MTEAFSNTFAISDFGAPNRLAFGTQPSAGASTGQTPWATQPTVRIEDSAGNLVSNSTALVTMSCVQASGTCSLNGTTSVQAVNGIATFTDLRTHETGLTDVVLGATAAGLISTQSNSFNGNDP